MRKTILTQKFLSTNFNMTIAFLLGRTTDLAFAELQVVLKTGNVQLSKNGFALWQTDEEVAAEQISHLQARLGGSMAIAKVVAGPLPKSALEKELDSLLSPNGAGKFTLGMSSYGVSRLPLASLSLHLKQVWKQNGFSLRYILPKVGDVLSSAQVLHNHLAELDSQNAGREMVFLEQGTEWLIAVTQTVQDINDYTNRDINIPAPNAVSGMLPPKLAQTMVNLAIQDDIEALVYDPFCGNGRIVSEARLMGVGGLGSDISPEQVVASQKNLAWMAEQYGFGFDESDIWLQDAREASAVYPLQKFANQNWVIATEPYLGKPLREPVENAATWLSELESIYLDFFQVWATAKVRPARMIVVFPRAKQQKGPEISLFKYLVDRLREMGYTETQVAVYGRPDAFVSREIVQIDY